MAKELKKAIEILKYVPLFEGSPVDSISIEVCGNKNKIGEALRLVIEAAEGFRKIALIIEYMDFCLKKERPPPATALVPKRFDEEDKTAICPHCSASIPDKRQCDTCGWSVFGMR